MLTNLSTSARSTVAGGLLLYTRPGFDSQVQISKNAKTSILGSDVVLNKIIHN